MATVSLLLALQVLLSAVDASVIDGVLTKLNIAATTSVPGAEAELAPPPQPEPHPSPTPLPPVMNCSLNGFLDASGCSCSRGWHGAACEFLNVSRNISSDFADVGTYGVAPNVTAWGATLVQDLADKSYHLFTTEEQLGCGMTSWKANSAIIHAVSSSPGKGAFKRVGMVLPDATNPAVHYDGHSKLWRMLVLPTGMPGKQHHCGKGGARGGGADAGTREAGGANQLYSTASLDKNFTLTPASFPNCNNPSGATDSAGTAWLLCHGGTKGYGPGFFLYSAKSGWTAPASGWASHGNILRAADGVRAGSCEDPSLWIDPSTSSPGNFHVFAHCYSTIKWNGTEDGEYCAGHLYAAAGTQTTPSAWKFHGAAHAPYGFGKQLSTRERPTLTLGADGAPAFLTNGVSPLGHDRSSKGNDWAFTLVQAVSAALKSDDELASRRQRLPAALQQQVKVSHTQQSSSGFASSMHELAMAEHRAGRQAAALAVVHEAERLLPSPEDGALVGPLLLVASFAHKCRGEFAAALSSLDRLGVLLPQADRKRLAVRRLYELDLAKLAKDERRRAAAESWLLRTGGQWASAAQMPRDYRRGLRASPWWALRDLGAARAAVVLAELREALPALQAEAGRLSSRGAMHEEPECLHAQDEAAGQWQQFEVLGRGYGWEKRAPGSMCDDANAPAACAVLRKLFRAGLPLKRAGYSLVQPSSWIRPHFGETNGQLKLHFGVQAQSGCATLRVGDSTRSWASGELLFFDDSYEHEVRSKDKSCAGDRVVFQMVIHHPDLPVDERPKDAWQS